MQINHFMKDRKSTREFKLDPLTKRDVETIASAVQAANDEASPFGAEYIFVQEGQVVREKLYGQGGYAGVMIEAPAYIALTTNEEDPKAVIYGAYYLQKLVTKLDDLNLGSCWISISNVDEAVKDEVFATAERTVSYLIGVGYPKRVLALGEQQYSSRLALEDYVFMKNFKNPATEAELKDRGLIDLFYYIKFAPSSKNKQPWRYVVNSDNIELYIHEYEGEVNLVDAGISMYYLEELARAEGLRVEWKVDPKSLGQDYYIGMAML